MSVMTDGKKINLEEPRWDQNTYGGRARHFFATTNPFNLLATSNDLERARKIVRKIKKGTELELSNEEIWRAKHLYDSAFHPDTGEKMLLIGRMSAQVPMNMLKNKLGILGRSNPAVIFWQWINQSFNAIVNYTNRSGDSPITNMQLGVSYLLASSGAVITAVGLNSAVKSLPPIVGRLVPFAAVAAANCVNIPMMRMHELQKGIPIFDAYGRRLGESTSAAASGITQVVLSRIAMASPSMVIPPLIMNHLETKGVLKKFPMLNAPIQIVLCGLCSMSVSSLEPEMRVNIGNKLNAPDIVYFNK
uniref:Sidoreflexin n=1 Tax=Strigamia maritima TaxID=126957 RepID=T1JH83_STRMM